MYCKCVILILTIFIDKLPTAGTNNGEGCGVLSGSLSGPIEEGQTATLVYSPYEKYLNSSRQWTRIEHPSRALVFNSSHNSSKYARIFEDASANKKQFSLIIQNLTSKDAGKYNVICGEKPIVYSSTYQLHISKVVPATHSTIKNTIATSAKYLTPGPSVVDTSITFKETTSVMSTVVSVTYARTNTIDTSTKYPTPPSVVNKETSTRMRDAEGANRKEDLSSTYATTQTSITSAKNDTLTTSADITKSSASTSSLYRTNTTNVSHNQANVDVPTKRIRVKTYTEKAHEATVLPENASDEMIHSKEKDSIPTWVTVVLVAAAVAILMVIAAVVRYLQKGKGKHPNGSQESAHYSRSDEKTELTGQTDEIPEYAKVIPKEHRKCDSKQETCEETTPRINNTETNNQLVYAELDLQSPDTFKQSADQNKATEYVSVDFSQTGTIQVKGSQPEKNVPTEYVSVDFTKTGTTQENKLSPEK